VLNKIHATKGAHHAPHLTGFDERSVSNFIRDVDNNVGAFWQSQFTGAGYRYTPATEVILQPTDSFQTTCGPWSGNTQNAAYCATDNSFYLPLNFLTSMYRQYGDAGMAFVIAHENGHHVQQLLGILPEKLTGQLKSIQIELQADCFAGIWMSSVYNHNQLSPGDIEHVSGAVDDAGDPNGSLPTDPQAHGGPHQRLAAFEQGYGSGQGGQCAIPALPSSES
jgi:predicted metalloprotease